MDTEYKPLHPDPERDREMRETLARKTAEHERHRATVVRLAAEAVRDALLCEARLKRGAEIAELRESLKRK